MDEIKKFWKKYINSNYLERRKMIKQIYPTFNTFTDGTIMKIPNKELRDHILINLIQGYFDDLIMTMRDKNAIRFRKKR